MRQVNEVLVIFREFSDDLLVPLKLPRGMLHRVQNKNTLGDVLIFMRCEPVRKDGVGRLRLVAHELHDLDPALL